MKYLIVGLGNPGPKYNKTRHNVGFIFANFFSQCEFSKKLFGNYLISDVVYEGNKFYIVKPQTFMNKSGDIFERLYRTTGVEKENTIIVVDNMDLKVGKMKLKFGGGDAGHNGLKSIISRIGTKDFFRLYIGVDRPQFSGDTVSHVLGKFATTEEKKINQAIEFASHVILKLPKDGKEKVIREINSY